MTVRQRKVKILSIFIHMLRLIDLIYYFILGLAALRDIHLSWLTD